MTAIAFHFNAPNKLAYACRLLRKACGAGSSVAVVAEEAGLAQLDEQLWSFSALDFVPHVRMGRMPVAQQAQTPVWLCETAVQGNGRQVLVNLTPQVLQGFEQFERLIEVVSLDDADRQQARSRWKYYTERGYEIVRHDLKLQA
ncbi:MAG: DNA polymerase III subunit chi [Brachymonas sp.]